MDVQQVLTLAQDAMTVRRVFGDPITIDGTTLVPMAIVGGGGGGGVKGTNDGGVGFGISARPAGAFVMRNGDVQWRPAIDVNKIILGGQAVAVTALLVFGPLVRAWLRRRLS